jgi:hypothetical protein
LKSLENDRNLSWNQPQLWVALRSSNDSEVAGFDFPLIEPDEPTLLEQLLGEDRIDSDPSTVEAIP